MFKFLRETFYYKTTKYYVNASKEEIVEQLSILFTEKRGWLKSPNLYGEFVDYPNTFIITPKWEFASIRGLERSSVYLKGTISDERLNETILEIAVRPNFGLGLSFIFGLAFGVYYFIKYFTHQLNKEYLLGSLSLLFILLPVLIIIVRLSTYRITKRFERYLNIYPS